MAKIIVSPTYPGGIGGAVQDASEGDILWVLDGTYKETVTINKSYIRILAAGNHAILDGTLNSISPFLSANSPRSVAFNIFPLEPPVISPAPTTSASVPNDTSSLQYDRLQGIEVSGFTIKNYGEYGIQAELTDYSHFTRNHISGVGKHGISIINGTANLLSENTINKAGENGIDVGSGTSPFNFICGNNISNCTGWGIDIAYNDNAILRNHISYNGGGGIHIYGQNNLVYQNFLLHNSVSVFNDTGISFNNDANILIENIIKEDHTEGVIAGNYSNHFIYGNEIFGSEIGFGLDIQGKFNVIQNNKITHNATYGLNVSGQDNVIYNNFVKSNTLLDIKATNVQNVFFDNHCSKSDPPNLCSAYQPDEASFIIVQPDSPTALQDAVNGAEPGDVIFVKKGVYHESITISTSNIFLVAECKDTILDGNHLLKNAFTLDATDAVTGVVINGFSITRYNSNGIQLVNAVRNRIIKNRIYSIDGNGISMQLLNDNLIYYNMIHGVKEYGIYTLYVAPCAWILKNDISECSAGGIYLNTPFGKVIDNNIYNNGGNGISSVIGLSFIAYNEIKCNNTSYDYSGLLTEGGNNTILGNKICNNQVDGLYQQNTIAFVGDTYDVNDFISGNTITHNQRNGVFNNGVDLSSYYFNHITCNLNGVVLLDTSNTVFYGNEIKDNAQIPIKEIQSDNVYVL